MHNIISRKEKLSSPPVFLLTVTQSAGVLSEKPIKFHLYQQPDSRITRHTQITNPKKSRKQKDYSGEKDNPYPAGVLLLRARVSPHLAKRTLKNRRFTRITNPKPTNPLKSRKVIRVIQVIRFSGHSPKSFRKGILGAVNRKADNLIPPAPVPFNDKTAVNLRVEVFVVQRPIAVIL